MKEIKTLEKRRREILKEIEGIRSMRKGSVTEQYVEAPIKGKEEPVLRGPYWVYTRKEKGKTVSQRLRVDQAQRYREEVEAYHRFQKLSNEYAEITVSLGELERHLKDNSMEKKLRKSPSRKTRK